MADHPNARAALSVSPPRSRPRREKFSRQARGHRHRHASLVQDDIVFKDLGLVVIAKEQRLAWLQRKNSSACALLVDVLT